MADGQSKPPLGRGRGRARGLPTQPPADGQAGRGIAGRERLSELLASRKPGEKSGAPVSSSPGGRALLHR